MGATACGFATDAVEAPDGMGRGLVELEPVGGCIGATGCGGAMHAVGLELHHLIWIMSPQRVRVRMHT